MEGLAAENSDRKAIMIDVSKRTPCVRESLRKYLKAHRTATSMAAKRGMSQWNTDGVQFRHLVDRI